MTKEMKGKFVFIPDDGSVAYEIDITGLLEEEEEEEETTPTLLEKAKGFFRKQPEMRQFPSKEVKINLPEMVCHKLEELFSTAEWRSRDLQDPPPCYIVRIFPRGHGEGWEPMITLTLPGGSVQDMTLGDLITDYLPFEPSTEGFH